MPIRPELFDQAKALEVILYLAERVSDASFHSISKVLYCSDRKHLERYGRLICGDHYIAMRYGPVPSRIYDMMKAPLGLVANSDAAFVKDSFEVFGGHNLRVTRPANQDAFSKSELACLDEAILEWGHLSFTERTTESHDAAWRAADENGVITVEDIARTLPSAEELLDHLGG